MRTEEAIKERINILCTQRGWSIYELAKRSDTNYSTISEIMSGRSKSPTIHTLRKISVGFEITLSEFFNHDIFENIENE